LEKGLGTSIGERLFYLACREDLEGIIAKRKDGRYNPERQRSWVKTKNPAYTQIVGREKLFDKEESCGPGFGQESTIGTNRSNFLRISGVLA
jgi:hypothetical protein